MRTVPIVPSRVRTDATPFVSWPMTTASTHHRCSIVWVQAAHGVRGVPSVAAPNGRVVSFASNVVARDLQRCVCVALCQRPVSLFARAFAPRRNP